MSLTNHVDLNHNFSRPAGVRNVTAMLLNNIGTW